MSAADYLITAVNRRCTMTCRQSIGPPRATMRATSKRPWSRRKASLLGSPSGTAIALRRQAIRIEREVYTVKEPQQPRSHTASPRWRRACQPRRPPRAHWHIENRLHYVRDFTYDEDRCRVRAQLRNLACLTNAGISIVRCKDDFKYLPEANAAMPRAGSPRTRYADPARQPAERRAPDSAPRVSVLTPIRPANWIGSTRHPTDSDDANSRQTLTCSVRSHRNPCRIRDL